MMNYEIFKEVVAEKFMDYMSGQYKDMKLEIRPVDKVNVTLDGMNLVGEGDVTVTPTIYINDMYEHYQKTNDLQEVLQMAASKMEHALKEAPDVVPAIDFTAAKDNIVFQLVNTEQNKEMLLDMPNRSFQDLSIIYRWIVKTDVEGIQSTVIHNSLAEKLGISEEQMFKLAVENTRRIFPPSVKSMNDVIRDMFMKDGMPAEIADMMIGEMPAEQTMWVISNDRGINGAISMLYEDKLHGLAENLGTDLYIMPSSLHEVIAVSASMGDPNELAQMVAEINMDQVALDERLSNQVYHYDKDLRKGANVYIDTLTYDEFKMLGDIELGRRFTKLDEKEQKDKVNRELGNELEFIDESQKADNSSSGGTGGNSLGSRQVVVREKPTWEDTISNRMLHWKYSSEQKEEVKKAIAAGISKTKIMEYFYPDVSIEQMRTYREAHAAMH